MFRDDPHPSSRLTRSLAVLIMKFDMSMRIHDMPDLVLAITNLVTDLDSLIVDSVSTPHRHSALITAYKKFLVIIRAQVYL